MQDNIKKTIALYKDLGWKKVFARIRFWDAPFVEVNDLIPKQGTIIELGCGEGLFANFLALTAFQRNVIGVDIDKARIEQAQRGLKNTSFIHLDALKMKMPRVDAIVCMHLLHHLSSYKDQETLLIKCSQALVKGASLVIVEVEPKISWKYLITWLTDHFLVPWLFEKRLYSPIYFRKASEWKSLVTDIGLSCKITSAQRGKPFTHIIILCKKN